MGVTAPGAISNDVLGAELDPEAACTRLVAQANDAGGRDNITVLIVRFDSADPS